ncbi:MAG: glycosyltransferase [Eubacteriales bacterium]
MSLKVSVIVAAKNEEQRIGRCLRSLLAQDFPPRNFEVIVVDGGSDDDTQKVVEEFPVRLIVDKFGTLGHQRNTGVHFSRGEYVAFIDADCRAEPNWLKQLVETLDNSPEQFIAITGPNLVVDFDPPLAKTIYYMQQTLIGSGGSPQSYPVKGELSSVISAPNCNVIYRREVLLRYPYNNELTFGEDAEVNFRLYKEGYRFLYNPDAVVWHHRVSSVGALIRKMFNWGFVMARIALKHKNPVRWYAWLPPLIIFYILASTLAFAFNKSYFLAYGLLAYAMVICITVVQVFLQQKNIYALCTVFLLPCQHISYGLGMLWGLFIGIWNRNLKTGK